MDKKQIVIVGGGVAGLEIATALGRRYRGSFWNKQVDKHGAYEVTLIDRDSAHVWKPMLHTMAAGTRDLAQQQMTYIAQARDAGFHYQPAEMCGLDRAGKTILLAPLLARDGRELVPARSLPYDTLILSLGSTANDFGTPGARDYCYMIDSRLAADGFNQELRIRMLQSLVRNEELRIAILGGGATGVELAAELVQLAEATVAYGAHGLANKFKITLIESGSRILTAFPERISLLATQRLQALGVEVRTGTRIKAVTEVGFVTQDDELIPASLRVWAAGVKAPDFLAQLDGLEAGRNNQLVVDGHLRASGDPAIFALGDCASYTPDGEERPLPPTAQVAHQQAQYLINHLESLLQGQDVPHYRYRDMGALVSLGHFDAYGSLGKFGFFKGGFIKGRVAQLSHVLLYRAHQSRLYGFWRGGLIWLVDLINKRVRPSIRLD
ncbi:NADH dehydrogenase [Comamonas sp. BIGb0124]|uniref:NAD(P)/FAD-dependent oxidoreductase n=1 Tax=Comamonas sp. BIGb0124 TaxID=2485130 RepID=UPI000F46EA01|nr:NAD(P)/FAD-dependent oxidoreductase [Comamonas sp. BIGb0124]ROR20228.1 NADH dehydrogenase [Comamonas sp. BIGb0124]